jgi:hypothetical protein
MLTRGPLSSWWSKLVPPVGATTFLAVMFFPTAVKPAADQLTCPPVGSAGGETVEGFVKNETTGCTATHDGYIRKTYGNPPIHKYRLDVHATSAGGCTLRRLADDNQSCIVNTAVTPNPQQRGIVAMKAEILVGPDCVSPATPPCSIAPTMWPVNGSNQTTNQDQDVDSRVSGSVYNNNVPIWTIVNYGTTTLRFKSSIYSTSCMLSPIEKTTNFVVHVLECLPEWKLEEGLNLHPPASGPVKIVLPSAAFESARGPATDAAYDWSQSLGRSVSVQSGYGTCETTDELCIQLDAEYVGSGCAGFAGGTYDTSGVYTSSGRIKFPSNWNSGSPHYNVIRVTIAHELGHYFGLANRLGAGCGNYNTVMHYSPTACWSSTAPSVDDKLGPTSEDISPIQNATYGNNVRSTCGW